LKKDESAESMPITDRGYSGDFDITLRKKKDA
jgi:hypothetical protein